MAIPLKWNIARFTGPKNCTFQPMNSNVEAV